MKKNCFVSHLPGASQNKKKKHTKLFPIPEQNVENKKRPLSRGRQTHTSIDGGIVSCTFDAIIEKIAKDYNKLKKKKRSKKQMKFFLPRLNICFFSSPEPAVGIIKSWRRTRNSCGPGLAGSGEGRYKQKRVDCLRPL